MRYFKIADLCEAVNVGYVGPSTKERDPAGIPFLMGKNIGPGYLKFKSLDRVKNDFHLKNRKSQLQTNDIVVVRIGNSGQAARIPEGFGEANCAGLVIIKKPNSLIDANYLVYYLNSPRGRAYSISKSTGTTRQTLNTGTVAETLVPLPSLEKQREIVEKLDSVFAEFKNLETKSNSQITVMKELASQLIRKFLEDPLNESKQCHLDEISENLDSQRIPITRDVRTAGPFPYYGASGVIDYVDDFIFEGDALLVSEDGANLLARSTPIAFPVTGKFWVNNHAHILKFQDSNLQRFVEHFLESIKLDQYVTGAAQPKLTQTALNAIPIPVPLKSEELRQIVLKIEIVKELVSKYLTNLNRMNLLLEEAKMSLLDQLFGLETS